MKGFNNVLSDQWLMPPRLQKNNSASFLKGLFILTSMFVFAAANAQTCGDNQCAIEAGECERCPQDCASPEDMQRCALNIGTDEGICGDDPTLLGYPEVSEDGGQCSSPGCPTFEEFCADPANAGMGVTLCSRAMPCDQGGGTPAECPCEPNTTECGPSGVVNECADDCDCIGHPSGGLCEEQLCGRQCSLKCRNRRNISFDGAFSSCQMVCPTARRPRSNAFVDELIRELPAYCKGESTCGAIGRDTPRPNSSQVAADACGIYQRLGQCFTDCSDCSKNRLAGYFQICSGIKGLANGAQSSDFPEDFPPEYALCSSNSAFQTYADDMMFCLQAKASNDAEGCVSCDVMVNGLPNINIESGIIGSHTFCNEQSGFCELTDAGGDIEAISCFGAALGRAWGSLLGHHSPLGPIQAVGVCHLFSQMLACANGDGERLVRWQNQICDGFVDGCMSRKNLGDAFPQCTVDAGLLLTGGMSIEAIHALVDRCNQTARRTFCEASCPVNQIFDWIIELIGTVPVETQDVLRFESMCNQLITGDFFPFGTPITLPVNPLFPIQFPLPTLPGFDSGRDPCLTY